MFILACCGLFSALIFCSKIFPTEPEEFRKMEIHYSESDGFGGATSRLDIFGDGTIQSGSKQGILTTVQQDSLIQLFGNFSQYDPNYSPEFSNPHGDYHTIDYIYEGKSKSVTVYDPSEANIPESLQNIITYLDDLRSKVISQ